MSDERPDSAATAPGRRWWLPVLVGLAAGLVFLLHLGTVSLWQDEAATALLGERWFSHGRPLGYDGRNLVSMDLAARPAEQEALVTASRAADETVRFLAARGDFKPDTTWIGQPWGQFALAGASLRLLGHDTLPARLPFALAGLATVVLLFVHTRRHFGTATALAAALLLLANAWWVLHARQCRYYAPSSLLLLATVAAWNAWHGRRRFGAAAFVAAAWLWFQFDYGTFWPAIGALAATSLLVERSAWRRTLLAFAALAAAIAPWVWYYELHHRRQDSVFGWVPTALGTLHNFNLFVLPVVVLAAAAVLLRRDWASLPPERRRLLLAALAVPTALVLWIPSVAPWPFHRYLVAATPLGCLATAWLLVRLARGAPSTAPMPAWRHALATAAVLVAAFTPVLAWPVAAVLPATPLPRPPLVRSGLWRAELAELREELRGSRPDPDRAAVAWLRANARPDDEVITNYPDLPLVFYTGLRVRGGLALFRVRDAASTPRLFVFREASASSDLCSQAVAAECARLRWNVTVVAERDLPWGKAPDPILREMMRQAGPARVVAGVRAPQPLPLGGRLP